MVLALGWWTVLLIQKNDELYQYRISAIAKEMGKESPSAILLDNQEYIEAGKHRDRQFRMIISEALFFAVSLLIGIWIIYKSTMNELGIERQKNNFLLSITHELKTPLASIHLILDTFKKRKLESSQFQVLNQQASQELDRLESLVNNLLASARMEAKSAYNLVSLDLSTLMTELCKPLDQHYTSYNFKVDIESELIILGDQESLCLMINNLLSNAIKYDTDHKQIDLSLTSQSNDILIVIKDHGMGIPDREKSNVFKKFYRIGNEEYKSTSGTGLGLWIVDQIATAHKGKVRLQDNSPSGSIFTITIPAYKIP